MHNLQLIHGSIAKLQGTSSKMHVRSLFNDNVHIALNRNDNTHLTQTHPRSARTQRCVGAIKVGILHVHVHCKSAGPCCETSLLNILVPWYTCCTSKAV